jgi:hypothetical protein
MLLLLLWAFRWAGGWRCRRHAARTKAKSCARVILYYGYVDENSRPDGKGIIRYENGMEWTGVWSAGEQCTGSLGGCKSKF